MKIEHAGYTAEVNTCKGDVVVDSISTANVGGLEHPLMKLLEYNKFIAKVAAEVAKQQADVNEAYVRSLRGNRS